MIGMHTETDTQTGWLTNIRCQILLLWLAGHEGLHLQFQQEVEARKGQVWGPAGLTLSQRKQSKHHHYSPDLNPKHDSLHSCVDTGGPLWRSANSAGPQVSSTFWLTQFSHWTWPHLDQASWHMSILPLPLHLPTFGCVLCQLVLDHGVQTQVKFESQELYWLTHLPSLQKPWLLTIKEKHW